jgi:hypothetical protein
MHRAAPIASALALSLLVLSGCGSSSDDAAAGPAAAGNTSGAAGGAGGQGGGLPGAGGQAGGQPGAGAAGAAGEGGGGAGGAGGEAPGPACDELGCYQACLCKGGANDACVSSCTDGPKDLQEVELKSDKFVVPAHGELYRCQNFKNPFGDDVDLQATESFMTPGSHHLFAFYAPGATDGPLEECSGLEFTRSIHTSQSPHNTFNYPPGVGAVVKKTEGVRLAVHYVNPSDEPLDVDATVRFYVAAPGTVTDHAAHIFYNNVGVYVPPHSPGTAKKTCVLPKDISLFSVTSHMHKFGTSFKAETDDGQTLYESTSWSEAPFHVFDPPLALKKGQKVTYTCSYQNSTDSPLTFGESANTNEMCILSGRYFPADDGETIECIF